MVGGGLIRGAENTNMTDCISSLYTLLNTSKYDVQGLVSLLIFGPCLQSTGGQFGLFMKDCIFAGHKEAKMEVKFIIKNDTKNMYVM